MSAKIQQVFAHGWQEHCDHFHPSDGQCKAAHSIMRCKTGALGSNISICEECGHTRLHHNSCRNRSCPNCQAVNKEIWVDKRRAEVIDSPYFHVVFTLPHELNSLLYCNQQLLYGFFHRCCAETLLELSKSKKHLGATPGIIQVLHTWDQEIGYHVHMHCIISGGGLTPDHKIRKAKKNFFIPVKVLRDKFKGKFLAGLQSFFRKDQLVFSASCGKLQNSYEWSGFRISSIEKNGAPTSRRLFTALAMPLNTLAGTHIRSPYPTAASFP